MSDLELIDRLITVLSKEAGLKKPGELLKHNRELYICKFRDDAIYLAREATKQNSLGWEKLAQIFGARHHTSLISAHRRVSLRIAQKAPRRDGRTWVEWHQYIMGKVNDERV